MPPRPLLIPRRVRPTPTLHTTRTPMPLQQIRQSHFLPPLQLFLDLRPPPPPNLVRCDVTRLPLFMLTASAGPERRSLRGVAVEIEDEDEDGETRRDRNQLQGVQRFRERETDHDDAHAGAHDESGTFPEPRVREFLVDVAERDDAHAEQRDAEAAAVVPADRVAEFRQ